MTRTGRGEAAAGQSPWALGIPSRSSVIFGKYRSDLKSSPGSRHGCLPPTWSLRGYLPGPAPTKGDEHEPGPEMPAVWEVLLSRGPEHKCSHGPRPGSSAAACTVWAALATISHHQAPAQDLQQSRLCKTEQLVPRATPMATPSGPCLLGHAPYHTPPDHVSPTTPQSQYE